ncbi:hypothetical protein [Billgrantia aerodenitrificans]|uniref:Uncharacterized protein n=1 Tax=Billgrantia aerodenitrificans TaxID=2733483 RepID=A0ABS9B036_9GAMM|nr:hypothetical protein [Halomonas aerodenitrificans]MCE8027010.1 hypothetical protein [Halomonas aerodenitrificans]
MLGLSGYQSALVNERLAGNHRAASLAQMGAEEAVSYAWGEGGEHLTSADFVPTTSLQPLTAQNWASFYPGSRAGPCRGNLRCPFRYVSAPLTPSS